MACQDTEEMCLAISQSCVNVVNAVEKHEEERSPSSLDILIFHASDLYRLLLASEHHQSLEEIGRSITILYEIEERIGDSNMNIINPVPDISYQSRGRPKFNIYSEQIEHLLMLNFTCPQIANL